MYFQSPFKIGNSIILQYDYNPFKLILVINLLEVLARFSINFDGFFCLNQAFHCYLVLVIIFISSK